MNKKEKIKFAKDDTGFGFESEIVDFLDSRA